MKKGFSIKQSLLVALVGTLIAGSTNNCQADQAADDCYRACHLNYLQEVIYCGKLQQEELEGYSYIPLVAYLQGYSEAAIDLADAHYKICEAKAGKRKANCEIRCANGLSDRAHDTIDEAEVQLLK